MDDGGGGHARRASTKDWTGNDDIAMAEPVHASDLTAGPELRDRRTEQGLGRPPAQIGLLAGPAIARWPRSTAVPAPQSQPIVPHRDFRLVPGVDRDCISKRGSA